MEKYNSLENTIDEKLEIAKRIKKQKIINRLKTAYNLKNDVKIDPKIAQMENKMKEKLRKLKEKEVHQ